MNSFYENKATEALESGDKETALVYAVLAVSDELAALNIQLGGQE